MTRLAAEPDRLVVQRFSVQARLLIVQGQLTLHGTYVFEKYLRNLRENNKKIMLNSFAYLKRQESSVSSAT